MDKRDTIKKRSKRGAILSSLLDEKEGKVTYNGALLYLLFVLLGVVTVAAITFFVSVKSREEVTVPHVEGVNILEATITLQERGLIPYVQMAPQERSVERGTVISQSPSAGGSVRVGREVNLTVSGGTVVAKMPNFTNRDLAEVERELISYNQSGLPIAITLKEPAIYVYSKEREGVVIAHSPSPGEALIKDSELTLFVSRGAEEKVMIPQLVGASLESAEKALAARDIPFRFLFSQEKKYSQDIVIGQSPRPDLPYVPGTTVALTAVLPTDEEANIKRGAIEYNSSRYYPFPLSIELSKRVGGEETQLFKGHYFGGDFAYPYAIEGEAQLILRVDGTPVKRVEV